MSSAAQKTFDSSDNYTVAWLAALPIVRAAAEIQLDEHHTKPQGFTKHAADTNSCTFGCVSGHNVVIASLPSGEYGEIVTANMIGGLLASLPHTRVGLLVSIAAGVTGERDEADGKISINQDIRLGDLAVSNSDEVNGGVVQYDLYKAKARATRDEDGSTTTGSYEELVGFFNAPPRA